MIVGLNEFLFDEIMADSEIQSHFPGSSPPNTPRLFYMWAEKDADFPYIVHRQVLHPDPECWGIQMGIWDVDLWAYGPDAGTLHALRNRFVAMYQQRFIPVGDGFRSCRIWVAGEVPAAPQSDRVWRMTLAFNVRVTATGDIAAVVARESA